MKISEIQEVLKDLEVEELKKQIDLLKEDTRSGVIKLIHQYEKKIIHYQKEHDEWALKCSFDEVFHENRYALVGIDEVGRGPLAGPVVAVAVILPHHAYLPGVKDSKKLSELQREALYTKIQETALAIGIGVVDSQTIDSINILQATFEAMRMALEDLAYPYDILCVDGDKAIPEIDEKQHAVIAGDDKSASIGAASIIAKVTRDRMMKAYAKEYPMYDWESNKGYGSHKHYEAIRAFGITPLHRKSFLKNEGIF